MQFLDATCPLVSKVHVESERHLKTGRDILLIGHAGHPEVIGTMGQVPVGTMHLIETEDDARAFTPRDADNLALVTQTTLSVDDTTGIINILKERFPSIALPFKEDICYATTNRQAAVKAIAEKCDVLVVIGASNSSNSKRLVEVGAAHGANHAFLVTIEKCACNNLYGRGVQRQSRAGRLGRFAAIRRAGKRDLRRRRADDE